MSVEAELRHGLIDDWEALAFYTSMTTKTPQSILRFTVRPLAPWIIQACNICGSEHLLRERLHELLCTQSCWDAMVTREKQQSWADDARYDFDD